MDAGTVMFIVQGLLSVLGVVLWHLYTETKSQVHTTQKELADYKVEVAREYVSREEMDRFLTAMNRTIEQHTVIISSRLDRLENLIEKVRDRE